MLEPTSGAPRSGWWVWLLGVLAGFLAFFALSQAENPRDGARPVDLLPRQKPEPLLLVFIDSLSDRLAEDPSVMPNLAALRRKGASFRVEPCRDRLTYRCLFAAFHGSDASSVLALRENFSHEGMGRDTVLHLAAARGRVVGVGAHDLEAYRDAFAELWVFPSHTSPEAEAPARLRAMGPADVALVGFSAGDRAAHEHGATSPACVAVFREIDRSLGELLAQAPPGGHVVVFGDHGHDLQGRHLPGGEATTFAVYSGPAAVEGATGRLDISDHRALLSLLLGLPTPPFYQGPPLDQVFRPEWLRERYGEAPALRGSPTPAMGPPARALLLLALAAAALGAIVSSAVAWGMRRRHAAALGAAAVALRVASGAGYEPLGGVIHDHGDQPWRSAYLVVPLGSGLLIAWLIERRRAPGDGPAGAPWWAWGGGVSMLVSALLLFSTANYYGAARVVPYASLLSLALGGAWLARQRAPRPWLLALPALVALLFYDVTRVGGANGAQGYYELIAAPFRRHPLPTSAFFAAAAAGLCWLTPGPRRDRGLAAFALAASGVAAALGASPPPGLLPVLLASTALLLAFGLRASAFAAAWLSAAIFFKPPQAAALHALAAAALAALLALDKAPAPAPRRQEWSALALAAAGFLSMWPGGGMRFAGLDFSFMFRWVEVRRYEELWWFIGMGLLLKQAWPAALLGLSASAAGASVGARLRQIASTKVLLVAVFAAAWGLVGPLTALPGQEAINELGFVLFALLVLGLLGLPAALRRPISG